MSTTHDSAKKRTRESAEDTPLRPSSVTIVLNGFTVDARAKLSESIVALGGFVSDSSTFSLRVSHVVVKQLRNNFSSKVLAGALKGCWIVSSDWLTESVRRKMFVDEQPFGARFSRVTRPVFHKKIFFSPLFMIERKNDPTLQVAHINALLLTSYLGG
jgi:hypothetical protein